MSRGGKRVGAGRPAKIKKKIETTLRYGEDLAARIDQEARRRKLFHGANPCRADAIRAVLDENLPPLRARKKKTGPR